LNRHRNTAARAFALGLTLAVCAACAGGGLVSKIPPPLPVDPRTQMTALEQRIFDLVQDERHKLNPAARQLVLDSELMGVARQRSEDMADKKYFAHESPQGQTSASLIMDQDQEFEGLLGENLAAQHFLKQSGVDVETCAKRFVDTWLQSPAHRDNLAFTAYDRSAVGAAVGGDMIYVTQLFASDLGLSAHDPGKREVSEWRDPKAAAATRAGQQQKHAPNANGATQVAP
jgi:uncharacterized protein YkwD